MPHLAGSTGLNRHLVLFKGVWFRIQAHIGKQHQGMERKHLSNRSVGVDQNHFRTLNSLLLLANDSLLTSKYLELLSFRLLITKGQRKQINPIHTVTFIYLRLN